MPRLSVFSATRFLPEVEREFEAAFEVRYPATGMQPRKPLLEALAIADGPFDVVLHSLGSSLSAEVIEALPRSIQALATYSVGTDHIDVDAARRRGLAVFNTPGVLADSVAENAIFLMLGAARRATESIALLRERRWQGWTPEQLVGAQLKGRTLGVLGLGDIGTRIAHRAEALGMPIRYCNRKPDPAADERGWTYDASPACLVRESDVLMIACPSTAETRGSVNASLLAEARPGLMVVNIARGDIVDDEALLSALETGRVWAAGLDVFDGEPNLHPGYFEQPNVFMVPHIGSATLEARLGMGRILIAGLQAWQRGEAAPNRLA